jgi:hypothetical protein
MAGIRVGRRFCIDANADLMLGRYSELMPARAAAYSIAERQICATALPQLQGRILPDVAPFSAGDLFFCDAAMEHKSESKNAVNHLYSLTFL